MPELTKGDVRLHFEDEGSGAPVILLHGFGMTAYSCWGSRGWYPLLNDHGFRVIALDSRGHGDSSKFTDPSRYDADKMKEDVAGLLDHLGIAQAFFVGHSMGGRTVLNLAVENSARVAAAVLVSVGENVFASPNTEMLRQALSDNDTSILPPARARFVEMVLSFGNEPSALAAYCANPRPALSPQYVSKIDAPTKVVCGSDDIIVGDARRLTETIRGSELKLIPGCEHTDVLESQELQDFVVSFFSSI
jgi:pimeloyl-ACP methyl ester carboxylesterase